MLREKHFSVDPCSRGDGRYVADGQQAQVLGDDVLAVGDMMTTGAKKGWRLPVLQEKHFLFSFLSLLVSLRLVCSPNDNDNDDEVSRERYSKKITFDLFSHLINTIRISSSPNTYLYERNRYFYTRKRYFLYFPADQINEIRISCSAPDQLTPQQVRVALSGRTGTTPPAATGLQSVDNFHRGRSCTFRISIRKLCICVFRICASEEEVGGNKAVWM